MLKMFGPVVENTTVSVVEPLIEPDSAVMVVVPGVDVVAKPELLIFATVVDDELQVAEAVKFCVLESV